MHYSHVTEVLVNSPNELAEQFLLPSSSIVTKDLCNLYPELYCPQILETDEIVEGGVVSGVGTVYTLNLDHVFEGYNMAPIICLLNYLHLSLVSATLKLIQTITNMLTTNSIIMNKGNFKVLISLFRLFIQVQ